MSERLGPVKILKNSQKCDFFTFFYVFFRKKSRFFTFFQNSKIDFFRFSEGIKFGIMPHYAQKPVPTFWKIWKKNFRKFWKKITQKITFFRHFSILPWSGMIFGEKVDFFVIFGHFLVKKNFKRGWFLTRFQKSDKKVRFFAKKSDLPETCLFFPKNFKKWWFLHDFFSIFGEFSEFYLGLWAPLKKIAKKAKNYGKMGKIGPNLPPDELNRVFLNFTNF